MKKEIILAPAFSVENLIKPDGTLALSEQALKDKADILAEATPCTTVTTPSEFTHASNIASRIRGILKGAEADREAAKAPFFAICKAIDASKKQYSAGLEGELSRLDRLNGAYEQRRRDEERKAEEARAAEARRLAQEAEDARLDAERIAREARTKAEAAAAKGRELTDKAKADLMRREFEQQEEQERIEAERKRLEDERMAAAEQARQARQARPTGGTMRMKLNVEIHDLKALYSAQPTCVKLVPDMTQINYLINGGMESIPGVSWTRTPIYGSNAR